VKYPWKGQQYSLAALARLHGKTANCVNYRMDEKGLTLEEALTVPLTRSAVSASATPVDRLDCEVSAPGEIPRKLRWKGAIYTLRELAALSENDISEAALRGRLTIGWKLKDAMTQPVKSAKHRAKRHAAEQRRRDAQPANANANADASL